MWLSQSSGNCASAFYNLQVTMVRIDLSVEITKGTGSLQRLELPVLLYHPQTQ